MTSISATSNSNYLSPLRQLQDGLQADVNSGAINSADQSALSSALNDIDASLQAGSAGDPGSNSNASPADPQSKIDSLIASEVSSGKLTSDQATDELDRRLKVFGGNHFGICPTINLHGVEFRAVLPAAPTGG